MPRRAKRKQREKSISDWARETAVSADEFAFACVTYISACQGTLAAPNPTRGGMILFDEETGEESQVTLSDIPMNRGRLAVREHCGGGPKYYALMARIFAYGELNQSLLRPWAQSATNYDQLCFQVAAEAPLNRKLLFDPADFVSRLVKLGGYPKA